MTDHMQLANIGPITEANLAFGDLTVLVGPQATGKSIAFQFLKLLIDTGQVKQQMTRYGLDWKGKWQDFLDAYLGEGMHSIWSPTSRIQWGGAVIAADKLAHKRNPKADEYMFLIPAQRVLALRDGWPRPFADYSPGDPYTVRDFSEKLRTLVEREFGQSERLFPQKGRLKSELRKMLTAHVFGGFSLTVDKIRQQKRLVLGGIADSLPFMVWSAGQREFVPLLLGLYWLMPPTKTPRRGKIEWVVIEELEMGLHPRAITVVLLMVLELVTRGYRVCLSTHSPQVLEAVWAIQQLRDSRADAKALLKVFNAPATGPMQEMATAVLAKELKVYYFDRQSGKTTDISGLDPANPNAAEAAWGGLAEFSAAANAAVAEAVASKGSGGGAHPVGQAPRPLSLVICPLSCDEPRATSHERRATTCPTEAFCRLALARRSWLVARGSFVRAASARDGARPRMTNDKGQMTFLWKRFTGSRSILPRMAK